MALLRSDYLEHLRRAMLRACVLSPDDMLRVLVPGCINYVHNGTLGTLADRRDAMRILLNALWQQILTRGYHGHQMQHWLVAQGVDAALAENIPNLPEPTV